MGDVAGHVVGNELEVGDVVVAEQLLGLEHLEGIDVVDEHIHRLDFPRWPLDLDRTKLLSAFGK